MIHCNKLKNIPTRVNIIGVPISVVNMESCISFLFSNWDAVHGNYVCVSNVHTTVMAHDDPQYYKVQAESLLSVPDGKPLFEPWEVSHGFAARNFAHLFVVSSRQHKKLWLRMQRLARH